MIYEPELQRIYWEAYNQISLKKIKSNGKKGLPTCHGAGLRAVWNAAIASVTPGGAATSSELFEALGMSKERAAQDGIRLDAIASDGPQLVKK